MFNFINQPMAIADLHRIGAIGSRLQSQTRNLKGFESSLVVQPMAGLLTRPKNHAATTRIEVLIHLARRSMSGHSRTISGPPTQMDEWRHARWFRTPNGRARRGRGTIQR